MPTQAIWVFDSLCALCDGGVQYTLKHEKTDSIRFVAIQSQEGRDLATTYGIDHDDPATLLFIENGAVLEKSDAILALARHLKGPARLVLLTRFLPRRLRDIGYKLLARYRYRLFGKKDACMVPTAANQHRFNL
ncbi:thiol-disulfide oxidoreductase DCC family protein [uncultured Roseobacter sp.]|uniref:thiol-disulfide oxidoreductase DCC family protein n=1 Tax=uncultured Roseobacter sp. TaxID=114847 RepID=UPI002627A5BD|nr:DCC1-like thiol-disulfide oxidoreductase family protein [uncultured Roseobacter sp.]